MTVLPEAKIDGLVTRFAAIDAKLATPLDRETLVKLGRERAELEPVHDAIVALRSAQGERAGLEALLDDPEMGEMASDEAAGLDERIAELTERLRKLLLPKDAADEKSAILEIRAGTGGSEAALFAGDLFRMYQRYADLHGWKVEVLSESEGDAGGYKEIIAEVRGRSVFARLKFEVGRAPGAARAAHRSEWAYPYLGCDCGGAAGGGGGRRRHPARGHPDRYDTRLKCRWPARQHHRTPVSASCISRPGRS